MKLGLFSVSYAGLWGQKELGVKEFIGKAAKLGYEAVMLMGKRPHVSAVGMKDEELEEIKKELKKKKIECAAVGGYTDFSCNSAAEVPFLEMQVAYVESLSRMATALGASMVRVFTGYDVAGEGVQASWNRVVQGLQESCDRAAAYGVTLAVQNHHDIAVHTDALLELLGDVNRPNCKLAFDAWSPYLRGEKLYDAALKAAPHMAMTTNADYIRLPRSRYQPSLINYQSQTPDWVRAVPFGTGTIDYRSFFQGLIVGGFDGLCSYEMCSPLRSGGSETNLDHYASTYLTWMRDHKLIISTPE